MAQICSRCGKQAGLLSLGFDSHNKRCKDCAANVRKSLEEWRSRFRGVCATRSLNNITWSALLQGLSQYNISQAEATDFVRKESLAYVHSIFAAVAPGGQLGQSGEEFLLWMIGELRLGDEPIVETIDRLSTLREARAGNLPQAQCSIVLASDEFSYLEVEATYEKPAKPAPQYTTGRLILTNKKIVFSSVAGGADIPWSKVQKVTQFPKGIFLELSRKANHGLYVVRDPEYVATIADCALLKYNRRLVRSEDRDTRYIPQHLYAEVYSRDQGKCRECGATEYLEVDHIIPYSKGGATSLNNLQLLCRRCNLAKGDRL